MTNKNLKIRRFGFYHTISAILATNSYSFYMFIDRGHIDIVIAIMVISSSIIFLLSCYRTISLSISDNELMLYQGLFSKGHHFKLDSIQEIFVDAINNEPYLLKIKLDSNNSQQINLTDQEFEVLTALFNVLQEKVIFHPSIKAQFI